MMVETGAQLNECTWGFMGGQPSDPADKVCINLLRGALSRMSGHLQVNKCFYFMCKFAEQVSMWFNISHVNE